MTAKELYNMKLHQELNIDKWTIVLRVPGGWIYQTSDSRYEGDCMAIFVPFNNEFMSCYNKEELENMLEDVVNELCLSKIMIEKHGPLGTPPAELVRLVLQQKNMEIRMLKQGIIKI